MTRRLSVSLGVNDRDRRKEALEVLAEQVEAYGRNGVPSISEMVCRVADAADFDMEQAAQIMRELMHLAGTAHVHVVEGEEMVRK